MAFGERRFPRCKFVQDVSRNVAIAGATEDEVASIARDERMKEGAQSDVDAFYSRMLQPA